MKVSLGDGGMAFPRLLIAIASAGALAAPAAMASNGESGIVFSAQTDEVVGGVAYFGPPDIWRMSLDGTEPRQLTSNDLGDHDPVVAPDGTIYFTRFSGEYVWVFGTGGFLVPGNFDIWRMNPDGTGEAPVTLTPHRREWFPDVSPDGRLLAYARRDGSMTGGTGHIVVRGLRDDSEHVIEAPPNADYLDHPTFLGTGERLVFVQYVDDAQQIVTSTPEGTDRRIVATVLQGGHDAVGSPDGTRIAFSVKSKRHNSIRVIHADGTGERDIVSGGSPWAPAWSPDAAQLVFTRGDRPELFSVNADGSGLRRIGAAEQRARAADWFGPRPARFPPPPAPAEPPAAPAPAAAEVAPASPLVLHSRTVRADRRGRLRLRLTCTGGASCLGRVALVAAQGPRRPLAKGAVTLRGGRTGAVRLRLTTHGRRILRARRATSTRVEALAGGTRHGLGRVRLRAR